MSIKTLMGYPIFRPFDPNKTRTWAVFGDLVLKKLQGSPHELQICRCFVHTHRHTLDATLLASAPARKVAGEAAIVGVSRQRPQRAQRTEAAIQKRLRQRRPAEAWERLARGDVSGGNVSRGRRNLNKSLHLRPL